MFFTWLHTCDTCVSKVFLECVTCDLHDSTSAYMILHVYFSWCHVKLSVHMLSRVITCSSWRYHGHVIKCESKVLHVIPWKVYRWNHVSTPGIMYITCKGLQKHTVNMWKMWFKFFLNWREVEGRVRGVCYNNAHLNAHDSLGNIECVKHWVTHLIVFQNTKDTVRKITVYISRIWVHLNLWTRIHTELVLKILLKSQIHCVI